jgi:hypothetical protein
MWKIVIFNFKSFAMFLELVDMLGASTDGIYCNAELGEWACKIVFVKFFFNIKEIF